MKIIIVGGVAGGASAAARLRRLNEDAEIILVERGPYVSFANCGLPYHIGGVIENRDSLFVQTVEGMAKRFALDIRVETEATAIDREAKTVTLRHLPSGEERTEPYDKLLLSPGAAPVTPAIPGLEDADNVYRLRDIPDTDAIIAALEGGVAHATVVGGGFIGLEMAENLRHRGIDVALLEATSQVMAPVDPEIAAELHSELLLHGIDLHLDTPLEKVSDGGRTLHLAGGKTLATDLILLAIGVAPETALAEACGLSLGQKKAIVVNDHMQTSDPDIYAVGDAVEVRHLVSGQATVIPLAGPANRQGHIAADHMSGRDSRYAGSLGTSICKVFDLDVASCGLNERALDAQDLPYQAVHIAPAAHAGYYPGATQMSLKLLYHPDTGAIWGAQGVGRENIDKAIDAIATAIFAGLSAYDLADLELAYAPPFGSAKSPVNFLGYVARNIRDGLVTAEWSEVDALADRATFLIDVSTPEEHQADHMPGAVNIPVDELRDRLDEIPKDQPVYIHCAIGLRGYIASQILRGHGYQPINIAGGLRTYNKVRKQFDVEPLPELPAELAEAPASSGAPEAATAPQNSGQRHSLDLTGLQCPGPMLGVSRKMDSLPAGDVLTVTVSDPGFLRDITAWCRSTGNTLLGSRATNQGTRIDLLKGKADPQKGLEVKEDKDGFTIIVFSGALDKVLAAFVIANGAAAMGKKVTLFFTFWGLSAVRRKAPVKKNLLDRAIGSMLPRGPKALPLSQWNILGLGAKAMRRHMQAKNVDSLEKLILSARKNGVELLACSMSMDVMGIRPEELLPGVDIAGVGAYIGKTEDANTNLFI